MNKPRVVHYSIVNDQHDDDVTTCRKGRGAGCREVALCSFVYAELKWAGGSKVRERWRETGNVWRVVERISTSGAVEEETA